MSDDAFRPPEGTHVRLTSGATGVLRAYGGLGRQMVEVEFDETGQRGMVPLVTIAGYADEPG